MNDITQFSTDELVAELSKREGVEMHDVDGDFYLQRDGGGYKVRFYVICNRCGHDRFEICDSRQEIGPSGLTVYSLWIAQCMECGTIHEINISKMQVSK